MKKVLLFSLLLLSSINANEIERQIYTKIIHALFPQKTTIKLYTNDTKDFLLFKKIPSVQIVSSPYRADLLIIHSTKEIPVEKFCHNPILVERYYLLKRFKNCVVGGFFWHKGRPNILFLKPSLQRLHIKLPQEFDDFIEDEL